MLQSGVGCRPGELGQVAVVIRLGGYRQQPFQTARRKCLGEIGELADTVRPFSWGYDLRDKADPQD
jgi:hypothetical protein